MNLAPQFGFFEVVVVAVVALIFIGPRDLPKMMREAGRFAGKARRMASEFRSAFDQMAREAEMEDMRREIEALKQNNAVAEAGRAIGDAVRPLEAELRAEAGEIRDAVRRPAADEALGESEESGAEAGGGRP